MLISTKGRYALRLLSDLAEHRDQGAVSLGSMAARQGISEKYLEAVLKPLVRENILEGMRGKGGGYRLTREPSEYTVGEILWATEGDLAPVACLEEGAAPCPRCEDCRTLPLWRELNSLVSSYLDSKTLADLMGSAS